MTIYTPNGISYFEVPVTKDAIIKYVLMGDYYIELPFNLDYLQTFARGSYILYQDRKFEIMSTVRPEFQTRTGGYKYTLKFEAQQNHMKRRKVFWLKGANAETCFHDTTTLGDFGTLIVDNMNLFLGGENWKMAAVPDDLAKTAKLVSFNADSCWDALTNIAETFEVEWWTVENGAEVWLYFGKLEFGTPERFEQGDVVTSIPAKKGDDSNYGTRFFIFGSTRNLPEDYNKTEQGGVTNHVSEVRLHLPDGRQYIDARENLAQEDIIEQVAFFEDVFPKNTETVTSIETIKRKVENSEEQDRTFDAYVMYCKDTPFIPSDVYPGETLSCRFTSGSLNGREFDLAIIKDDNEHSVIDPEKWTLEDGFNKKFEIIADVETYGEEGLITIPNADLHPEPGDTFVLTGVKLPQERIDEAEQELLKLGQEWAKKNSTDTDVYHCPTNPVYCHRNDKNYELGQKVLLVDVRFGEEGRISRIQGFEKKLWNEYEATYTVGDNSSYSRLGSIETSISESAYAERIGVVSGVGIYLIRSKYDTTAPTDYNAYSAAAVEALFLNKIKGGTVSGKVRFAKDVTVDASVLSQDYRAGEFSGAGYKLGRDAYGNSVLEVDRAIVRKEAIFNETIINQVSFQLGETIFSQGGCTIEKVEEQEYAYRCYYDNKDGQRYSGFKVGDQARCQRYDAESKNIIKYYWRLVTEVGEDYVDLSKTDFDGTGIPAAGDNIIHFGNRNDIARQSAIVINPLDGGSIEIFSGIDSYTLSEKNHIGMGTNPATGEAYLYGYGNLYFGDRDMTDPASTWMTFQRKDGTDRPKLYIKGNIEMGSDTTGLQNVTEFKNLEDKVDNIQIGGLNLLTGTKGFTDGWSGIGTPQASKYLGLTVYYADATNTASYLDIRYQVKPITPDTEYTLSFYAKGAGILQTFVYPSTNATILATNGDREYIGQFRGDGRCEYPLTSEWKRYFVTFRTTDDTSLINPNGTNKTILFRAVKGNVVYVCGAKLEKGNVPTDWSPAPEDSENNPDDLQFIKKIFPDGLINNAATVSQLLSVKNDRNNIVAGIYGGGVDTLDKNGFVDKDHGKLMIFAGASDLNNVKTAKTRIYDDGSLITSKLIANAAEIKDSTLKDVTISGTVKSPFREYNGIGDIELGSGDSREKYEKYDNLLCSGEEAPEGFIEQKTALKWDSSQNGRIVTFVNSKDGQYIAPFQIDAPTDENKYFFENGNQSSKLQIFQECVVLKGYGQDDIFYGWIVLSRTKMPGYVAPQTGFQLKPRHINQSGTISNRDSVLFVTANVTLTLPSDPEDGQMYFIKNITGNAITTLKTGSSTHYINDGRFNKKTSWTWSDGCFVIVVWDATNKTWQAGYTNNN